MMARVSYDDYSFPSIVRPTYNGQSILKQLQLSPSIEAYLQ